MEIYVLIVHLGIGLVNVTLHINEESMWEWFAQYILSHPDDDDFKPFLEDVNVEALVQQGAWSDICDAWSEYWCGEKYTDFQISVVVPASKKAS